MALASINGWELTIGWLRVEIVAVRERRSVQERSVPWRFIGPWGIPPRPVAVNELALAAPQRSAIWRLESTTSTGSAFKALACGKYVRTYYLFIASNDRAIGNINIPRNAWSYARTTVYSIDKSSSADAESIDNIYINVSWGQDASASCDTSPNQYPFHSQS